MLNKQNEYLSCTFAVHLSQLITMETLVDYLNKSRCSVETHLSKIGHYLTENQAKWSSEIISLSTFLFFVSEHDILFFQH